MKKVVSGSILQDKIIESINLLCGTVKKTLGPVGNNVLIDHSNYSPFITNDGVTIAQNIESEDETIGAILEIIKEASIKTNEEVGDGTTTTLVLLESLYLKSLEYIKDGKSPILLKKELGRKLETILRELEKLKRKATLNDLKNIASISAGERALGNIAFEVMQKVKRKEAISIKEIPEDKIYVSYYKGYNCDISLASPYFLKESNKLNYKNPYVLLMNTPFTNLECISFILNDILKNKRDLVIVASAFVENAIEDLVALTLTENINICVLKIEDYGMHIYEILKDIENISNAKIIERDDLITGKDIGIVESLEITENKIKISFKRNEKIKTHLKELKKQLKEYTSDLEKEFYEKRIAMFSNGSAEIKLGSPTKTESIEKRMRLEDAICALSATNKGILIGSGISLLQVANGLKIEDEATKIWKETLEKPFEQILNNAGLDFSYIKKIVEKEDYKTIYNVSLGIWEKSSRTAIIDPFLVIEKSLINATSIASMLLTTTSLIINEYKKNNKVSEYNNNLSDIYIN